MFFDYLLSDIQSHNSYLVKIEIFIIKYLKILIVEKQKYRKLIAFMRLFFIRFFKGINLRRLLESNLKTIRYKRG